MAVVFAGFQRAVSQEEPFGIEACIAPAGGFFLFTADKITNPGIYIIGLLNQTTGESLYMSDSRVF